MVTLVPPKIEQSRAFATFPKYVWATKCYGYGWYIMFQKSNVAAQKPEVCKPFVVICGSHHISSSRAHSNKIPTPTIISSKTWVAVGIWFLTVLPAQILLLPVWVTAISISGITRLSLTSMTTPLNSWTSKTYGQRRWNFVRRCPRTRDNLGR